MSLFPILKKQVEFRGKTFTVREMNHDERAEWSEMKRKQSSDLVVFAVHRQTEWAEPITVEELRKEPTAFVEKLGEEIMKISGLMPADAADADGKADEKKD